MALGKHAHPILPPVDGLDEEFIEKIMTDMKNDAIGKVIQKDPLILLFGVVFLKSRWHSSEVIRTEGDENVGVSSCPHEENKPCYNRLCKLLDS